MKGCARKYIDRPFRILKARFLILDSSVCIFFLPSIQYDHAYTCIIRDNLIIKDKRGGLYGIINHEIVRVLYCNTSHLPRNIVTTWNS